MSIVLAVDPSVTDLRRVVRALAKADYHVLTAPDFQRARPLLLSLRPSVLIANIQLGAYNGLHLVLYRQAHQPEAGSIITSDYADPMLEAEAERLGCPYLVKPVVPDELCTVVATALR